LVGTAVNAALNSEADPLRAGSLALRLIETADPPSQTSLELSANLTPEDIEKLSWSEALALARQLGIEIPEAADQGLNVVSAVVSAPAKPGQTA
jgi:hypothetical protein